MRKAVYLGILPHHLGSVALVLNIKTGYISSQFHIIFDDYFTTTLARTTNKLPYNWEDLFNNHRELPPEEFQFSIGKQWEKSTDRSEGDRVVKNNSPSDQIEGAIYRYIKNNLSPQREQVGYINRKNNNYSSSMAREGDNEMVNIMYQYKLNWVE